MPPAKRPSDAGGMAIDSPTAQRVKQPRLERGAGDFSSVVKSKLQSYTRTGQACDRCKVRKIRCDALPQGCSHCANQNLECFVTDRVTGRTERRGYMQELEREKNDMLSRIRDLERILEDNGVDVKPWQTPPSPDSQSPNGATETNQQSRRASTQWPPSEPTWSKPLRRESQAQDTAILYTRHALLEARPSDSHLGLLLDGTHLSTFEGTKLSILGTTIDVTGFNAPDLDEPHGAPDGNPLYNKSVQAFLRTSMNIQPPPEDIALPSREEAFRNAEWYFILVHPYIPTLHRPTFFKLVTQIYDEPNFKPSAAELVVVHMVLATIYFQTSIRNRENPQMANQLNDLSNMHYHWCLGKFYDLATDRSLVAIQALVMIALHTRSFPKPGCSSRVVDFTLNRAIDMKLHRAVSMPAGQTTLENEMRKRAWWLILILVVSLKGRLGKPMGIGLEDFDTEIPMAIPDECLGEDGILDHSQVGKCSYDVGIVGFKIAPLFMEMYTNIYSVRRDPRKYVDVVRTLEAGMQAVEDSLPDELKLDHVQNSQQNGQPSRELFALYCQSFFLEFKLCLRHPSLCVVKDPVYCAENTRICEDMARRLLTVVGQVSKLKSLDTTWYQLSVWNAAIFTTLMARWERRHSATASEISSLRQEMVAWLNILTEASELSGSGPGLVAEVSTIIERTIGWIEFDMNSRVTPPSSAPPSVCGRHLSSSSPFQGATVNKTVPATSGLNSRSPNQRNGSSGYYETVLCSSSYNALGYQTSSPSAAPAAPPPNQQSAAYDIEGNTHHLYTPVATDQSGPSAPTNANDNVATPTPLVTFASQATQHLSGQGGSDSWRAQSQAAQAQAQLMAVHSGNPWYDWTAAIADNQDRYSANALLTLGTPRGTEISVTDAMHGDASDLGNLANNAVVHAGQWPMILFHDGTNAVGGV